MRNGDFLTKPVGPFLKFLTDMCTYQINSHCVVRTRHNLKIYISFFLAKKLTFFDRFSGGTHNVSMSSCWINKVVIRRFHVSQISIRGIIIKKSVASMNRPIEANHPTDQGYP